MGILEHGDFRGDVPRPYWRYSFLERANVAGRIEQRGGREMVPADLVSRWTKLLAALTRAGAPSLVWRGIFSDVERLKCPQDR